MPPVITCECGACKKCKHRVYMRGYYQRNTDKIRKYAKESRDRNIDRARSYDRERSLTRVRDQVKVSAQNATRRLRREPCEVCGQEPAQGHHPDYSRPLEVQWLCHRHHMELHRTVIQGGGVL